MSGDELKPCWLWAQLNSKVSGGHAAYEGTAKHRASCPAPLTGAEVLQGWTVLVEKPQIISYNAQQTGMEGEK